jgi:hypothetical protein
MDSELENILAEGYLGDVGARSTAEIRALRAECRAVETQLSYLRRIVQGRHDIVAGELARRRNGGDRANLSELVEQLPQILSDRIRAPGLGRMPETLAPGELSGRLVDQLEGIVTEGHLLRLGELDDAGMSSIANELEVLEHEVSDLRRAMFGRIDTLQAELTRRYRVGEANVEELLRE